jgi:uncharacterized protein YmfQ (DUF2313 family)
MGDLMNAAAHARVLKALLPPGRLWNLLPDSIISKLFLAFGDEFSRVDTRGAALIEETDPRTATETLPEWEAMLGLPDEDIVTVPSTDAERRLAITQKFIRRGGQSPAYFLTLVAAAGYTGANSITEGYVATVARSWGGTRCNDKLRGGEWAHVWEVNVTPPPGVALSHAELEAVIRRAAPAHTVVLFNYL